MTRKLTRAESGILDSDALAGLPEELKKLIMEEYKETLNKNKSILSSIDEMDNDILNYENIKIKYKICPQCTFMNNINVNICDICEYKFIKDNNAIAYKNKLLNRQTKVVKKIKNVSHKVSLNAINVMDNIKKQSHKILNDTTNNNNYNAHNIHNIRNSIMERIHDIDKDKKIKFYSNKLGKAAKDKILSAKEKVIITHPELDFHKPSIITINELEGLQKHLNHKIIPGDQVYELLLRRFWDSIYNSNTLMDNIDSLDCRPFTPFVREGDEWLQMGFQRPMPDTDFRGGGMLALKCLVYISEAYPMVFQDILKQQNPSETGNNNKKWYPVCVAGINLTCMLAGILKLGDGSFLETFANYWTLFEEPSAFYELFYFGLIILNDLWFETDASYMGFSGILKKTKKKLLHILRKGPRTVTDLHAICKISTKIIEIEYPSDMKNDIVQDPSDEHYNKVLSTSDLKKIATNNINRMQRTHSVNLVDFSSDDTNENNSMLDKIDE